ncbi:MAG: hypothetical protein ACYTFW_04520 [Planctomycetota bacterium]
MPKSKETIRIEPCPICGLDHEYTVQVTVSTVFGFANGDALGDTREKSFIRFFNCPKCDKHFQATVSLIESPDARIKNVQILGLKGYSDE